MRATVRAQSELSLSHLSLLHGSPLCSQPSSAAAADYYYDCCYCKNAIIGSEGPSHLAFRNYDFRIMPHLFGSEASNIISIRRPRI
ncbi:DNA repair protein RecO [Dirofilaria immitis]